MSNGTLLRYIEDVAVPYKGLDCLIWPFGGGAGRPTVRILRKGHAVTRVICERIHGVPPTPAHHAAHSCGKGDAGCVAGNHLSWKTPTENSADRRVHGTAVRILDARKVRKVRALAGVISQDRIAAQLGISQSMVSAIIRGETLGWLE